MSRRLAPAGWLDGRASQGVGGEGGEKKDGCEGEEEEQEEAAAVTHPGCCGLG